VGLTLERLLAGLDTLGVDRGTALDVMEAVAMDSVPPLRRAAYEHLVKSETGAANTTGIAKAIGLPTNTVRRALEELAAYDLVNRTSMGQGHADVWTLGQGRLDEPLD
jgi:predicted ArsR family transcriptional regulator